MAPRQHTYRDHLIERGAFQGTADDRMDRWYIGRRDRTHIDRRGRGYATLADARAAIDAMLAQ